MTGKGPKTGVNDSGSAVIMDGRELARAWQDRLKREIRDCRPAGGRGPLLAIVRVDGDGQGSRYVRRKRAVAEAVGILSRELVLPATATQKMVEEAVGRLNADEAVDGVMVQLPLPAHLERDAVLARIAADKDVDGLTAASLGRLAAGEPAWVGSTVVGIRCLLKHYQVALVGARAVVVGRNRFVGMPAALFLNRENATVTVIHRKTPNPEAIARTADILVAAAGNPGLIGSEWVKPGAVIVDCGANRLPNGLVVGDVEATVATVAGMMTPVPGGVGPLTVAGLMDNTWAAYQRRFDLGGA